MAMAWWVRPWKLPWKTRMLRRPVAMRASFTAASTASAPLLEKKKRSMLGGVTWFSFWASVTVAGGMTMFIWPKMRRSACSWMAWTTRGCRWPVLMTPMPEVKSV